MCVTSGVRSIIRAGQLFLCILSERPNMPMSGNMRVDWFRRVAKYKSKCPPDSVWRSITRAYYVLGVGEKKTRW